jgi:AbrB family looped-hinge helix DNA binding protein
MQQFSTTMTERGQVTVPAEVRRLLGIKPREKVTFEVEGSEVRLRAVKHTLESAYGAVRPLPGKSLRQIEEEAADEHAQHVVDEMTHHR